MYNTVRQGVTIMAGQRHIEIEIRSLENDLIEIRVTNNNDCRIVCSILSPFRTQIENTADIVSAAIMKELIQIMKSFYEEEK